MNLFSCLIKLFLLSMLLAQPLLAQQEKSDHVTLVGSDNELTHIEIPSYNLPSNSDWRFKSLPVDFYAKPYQVNLFNDNYGQDQTRLWSQTKSVMAYGFGVAGFILLLPEEVSNWDKEDGVLTKWSDNVKEGPTWDRDVAWLNWIGHPYFGGVYYQVARKSGYRQWDAFLYSFMMSTFYWEYGIEAFAEIPSMQDLVITPVLGWAYGEWAYKKELTIRSAGGKVLGSEILGDIALYSLDPIDSIGRGINRLFDTEIVKAGTGNLNLVQVPIENGDVENQIKLNVSYQLGSGKPYHEPKRQRDYVSKNEDPVDVGIIGLGLNYGSLAPGEHWALEQNNGNGWNLGLYFSPKFSIKLDYLNGKLTKQDSSGDETFEQFNVGANYYFNSDARIRPFFTAGIGEMMLAEDKGENGDSSFALNFGAGLHYQINNNFALQLDAKRFFNTKYSNEDDAYNLSLIYFFGDGLR